MAFSLGIVDGTLGYQGRLCVANLDGLLERIMNEAHTSSYHASIQMASFEALYGKRCRSPIGWFEIREAQLIGSNLVHQDMEKVKIIKERLKTAQSCHKSDSDVCRRNFEFKEDHWVFLKVFPIMGIMRFGMKRKLSHRFVGSYRIIQRIVQVAYRIDTTGDVIGTPSISYIHIEKGNRKLALIFPVVTIKVNRKLTCEEILVAILDRQVRNLRNKEIGSLKVLWRNQQVEEANWEVEEEMKRKFPHLFD
ncbi:uncharacterized protein [Nicotiana sylvestris]|uniref:uncharacterized protein n=1 Tax=Nicotiana sylvestris TaxID=4096 RepID=UPI00388CB8E4